MKRVGSTNIKMLAETSKSQEALLLEKREKENKGRKKKDNCLIATK
jgi:hypothetical protein